ncbi:MAG TPA: hypothetical protein VM165_01535 [Planctomycetaceae bacterium]|nr:hypothetical protein [Planctomycetaceae bacterium]
MSDAPELPVIRCPMCGAAIAAGATICTECGEQRLATIGTKCDSAPLPARPGDIVFAVVVALIALGIALPLNIELTHGVMRGEPYMEIVVFMAAVWNTLVWGLPVVVVGRWWYLGTKRGDPDKTYLWRIYWKAQAATYGVITALGILLLTICAAAM